MPNQGNRSNGSKSNKGRGMTGDAEKQTSSTSKPNSERSDIKHSHENDGNTNRTSSQGRKTASGGS